jgi:hypothetical protein
MQRVDVYFALASRSYELCLIQACSQRCGL